MSKVILSLKSLEDRCVPSAVPPMANGDFNRNGIVDQADFVEFRSVYQKGPSPVFDFDDDGTVGPIDFAEFKSRYGLAATALPPIGISNNNGVVTLRTNAHRTTALAQPSSFNPQMINFTLSGTDSSGALVINASLQVSLTQLQHIYFYGHEGNIITFTNNTTVACTAYGGKGVTTLQGGSGADHLYAGLGDTTLRGMAGNDLLIGGPGDNYLYGGPGNDTLIPGPGPGMNFLFQD
jgi:Ca2+-binding RTX toxin-like protein